MNMSREYYISILLAKRKTILLEQFNSEISEYERTLNKLPTEKLSELVKIATERNQNE